MKILHIHPRYIYYDLVEKGLKNEEYRLIKPYWTKRLEGKNYDLIYYWRAFTKKKIIFKYDGKKIITIVHKEFGDKPVKVYALSLRKRVR